MQYITEMFMERHMGTYEHTHTQLQLEAGKDQTQRESQMDGEGHGQRRIMSLPVRNSADVNAQGHVVFNALKFNEWLNYVELFKL